MRVGAFDRSVLVIATPTGTGWVDPAGMAPLEILHRGDVASISGAVLVLAELAFPARRAGLWQRHGASRLPRSVWLLA